MIKVNLLVGPLVRPRHTPKGRFAMIVVAAALTAGVLAYLGSIWLMIMGEDEKLASIKSNMEKMKGDAAVYDDLFKQVSAVTDRQKLLETLSKRGVHWSVMLDHLWDILDGEKSLFITNLTVLDSQRAKGAIKGPSSKSEVPPFGLQLTVRMLSHDTNKVTALRAALAADEKIREAMPTITPVQEIVYAIKDNVPQMEFNLVLVAKPPAKPAAKAGPAPAAGAPAAGAQ